MAGAYIPRMRRHLLMAAFTLAMLNTFFEVLDMRGAVYALKPLATLALVAIVLRSGRVGPYRVWIAAGLTASLAGDILLMLPQDLFVAGLVAFLLAHLCYIRAFASDGAGIRASLLPAVPVFAAATGVLVVLWPSLGTMRAPVACYVTVISVMSWQAIARWRVRRTRAAALAAMGSLFFLVSDASIATRKFAAPFAGATLVIIATYYAAQWGIALSALRDERVTPAH